ncbi:MAG: coproporphyrinogen dehydrogenase HemZ [Oscillospiraceae bacterium]|nr:coproporphyrinogen dehydrogenase HemZ [Oscillospiraceae bacterium]
MKLYLRGHEFRYAVEQMMMTLFPGQKPEYPDGEPDGIGNAAVITLAREGERLCACARLCWEGREHCARRYAPLSELTGGLEDDRVRQRILRLAFYDAGVAALGQEPPWGALTGVRPVKLPTREMAAGATPRQAKETLTHLYRVSPGRAELAMDCANEALRVKRSLKPRRLSLYVGIPFCPTRCAYCSFISADVKGALAMVEPYVDALCREIQAAGAALKELHVGIATAYMGGGTPTTLTAGQMDRVLTAMERYLPMEECAEFTVEAGRPDTITADKLAVLKRHGVGRISVNPQTMEDEVLRIMGRAHTSAQIVEAMALAREHFGGLVNMDLIAGLPGDTPAGFARTMDRVLAMEPANITVHTLALKKGARLMEQRGRLCSGDDVAAMLAHGEKTLRGAGYVPYYLYRQKYMSGSFENVGWCRPGTACDYNIIMMEELQSVLSLGAGGVTKLVDPQTGKIERLANPKYPKEYLESGEKLAADKRLAAEFQAKL